MIALYIIADLYLFFIVYVASMNMIRAHAEGVLNGYLWALCLPFVAFAIVYDFLHNITLFWLLFWNMPREWLVTDRLKKHIKEDTYQGRLSRFLCKKILSPFDYTKDHCD